MKITDQPTIARYYQALLARDASYVGSFVVAVKTTGIFCIASCRARKPKLENVDFYSTIKDALYAGYRPCKVCCPTENASAAPALVRQALALLKAEPKRRLSDSELRQRGLSPASLRRWFQQHYQMTFQSFQRMYRVNLALTELKSGRALLDTALDSGYQSLSGFNYMLRQITGASATQQQERGMIVMKRLTTPLGPMFVCASERGVCLLEFVERRALETELAELQRRLGATVVAAENTHTEAAEQQLGEYFAGQRQRFELALDTPGTEFQRRVWQTLTEIPYAQTRSYQQQAERLGNAQAVRAVARANGANRVAIVIPCHRVIGKDGQLTGYAGGLERKRWLLAHEQQFSD
ncbi:bifunctional transcriptional activator/DNA repair enzyme AdaA [Idiomarina xiamenensis]|uniref:Methylated-DNA--protein-cysteine methyltransferase n=1 Tax=Idiomarina xiamenensis 10-D-4 TaxID=740709 RepID=K2KA87_9GAMM|nr:methylated-DNA--[protein]-cysteine S-methyltransferase [Idiomarina xiamenensis]EKE83457.1 methylated-DNA--protein-cysteine methyltransferase [Idiomarina xiamenensis 10-D-4]